MVNKTGDKIVSKKDLSKICRTSVNTLGSSGPTKFLGAKEDKYSVKLFEKIVDEKFKDKEEFNK